MLKDKKVCILVDFPTILHYQFFFFLQTTTLLLFFKIKAKFFLTSKIRKVLTLILLTTPFSMNLADDRRGVACTVLPAWPTLVRYTADMRDEVVVENSDIREDEKDYNSNNNKMISKGRKAKGAAGMASK